MLDLREKFRMSYEMELTPVEEEQYHQSLLSHATQIPNNSAMTQNTTNTNANIDNNNGIETDNDGG